MMTISEFRSDCGTRTATVHLHNKTFVGRTNQGELFEHTNEDTVEAWCEDYVQFNRPQDIKIVEIDGVINLKPGRPLLED